MNNWQLDARWHELWQQKHFGEPTSIQTLIAAPIVAGESFVAISPTGTGKTLAYLLPMLQQIEVEAGLQAIILVPSQELAKQIAEVAREWAAPIGVTVQLVVGGANFKRQQEALKQKPEVLIATPGRLLELQQRTRKLKVHQVKWLMIDEADYLIDTEHASAIEQIKKSLMRSVQTIWVSATYGEPLQQLVQQSAQALPVYQVEATLNTTQVTHTYLFTTNRQKVMQLKRLAQVQDMQAIVFFEQVHELESVAAKLTFQGVKVAVLHGQLSKQERELALRLVKQGSVTYLLTTDVAARGLDIPAIPYIIHFNRVSDLETYIHRSGRTGRMHHTGTVISLVNEQEWRDLTQLLAAETLTLVPRVVYATQLLHPEALAARQTKMHDDTTDNASPKPAKAKSQPVKKAKAQSTKKAKSKAVKPVKKKQRQRDQKNKGKRRVSKKEQ